LPIQNDARNAGDVRLGDLRPAGTEDRQPRPARPAQGLANRINALAELSGDLARRLSSRAHSKRAGAPIDRRLQGRTSLEAAQRELDAR
jgi:hypothetical protein